MSNDIEHTENKQDAGGDDKTNLYASLMKESIKECADVNPWDDTPAEELYIMTPKRRGKGGEHFVTKLLESEIGADGKPLYKVEAPTDPGHDRIVNKILTEIKFSLASKRNTEWQCVFNHIGYEKSWEEILFCCLNGDGRFRMVRYKKSELRGTEAGEKLKHQQGGNKSKNDDYMISGKNAAWILEHGELVMEGKLW